MNTVNYRVLNKAVRDLQNQVHNLYVEDRKNNPDINVLNIDVHDKYRDDDIVEIDINWACCGPVDINTSETFVKRFNKVLELVKNFPYNGYKISYGDED